MGWFDTHNENNIFFGKLEEFFNWGRAGSPWPIGFGLACCAIEMMHAAGPRFDPDRFGAGVFRATPRQADVMIVAGTITEKMAPTVVRLYNQMPAPKWVIAMGNCAVSGSPFRLDFNYNVVEGVERLIPVDVYVPGVRPARRPWLRPF